MRSCRDPGPSLPEIVPSPRTWEASVWCPLWGWQRITREKEQETFLARPGGAVPPWVVLSDVPEPICEGGWAMCVVQVGLQKEGETGVVTICPVSATIPQ